MGLTFFTGSWTLGPCLEEKEPRHEGVGSPIRPNNNYQGLLWPIAVYLALIGSLPRPDPRLLWV